jgi:CelD/BcsL family acetyltransferase involved in cellulose biosynthesis
MRSAVTREKLVTTDDPGLRVSAGLNQWASQWDELVDASALPSPFLRSWWLSGVAGREPQFAVVVEGDSLLGGIALEQARLLGLPSLRMIGGGLLCADHLDAVARDDSADRVASALRQWLLRPGERVLDLDGLRPDGLVARALAGASSAEELTQAPWEALPSSASDYLRSRPRTLRRTIGRASDRLGAEGVRHQACRGESVAGALEALRRLHQAQWGDASRFLPVFDRFAAACVLGTPTDEVAVHQLLAKDDVIACMVTFEVAGRVSLYQSARRTEPHCRDATIMLLSAIIADACERGLTEVDFLRGEEAYKNSFAPQRRRLVRLRAASGWAARLALEGEMAARRAKRFAAARTAKNGARAMTTNAMTTTGKQGDNTNQDTGHDDG